MSGLAEILLSRGFKVSGSDRKKTPLTESLEKKGVKVFYSQISSNITDDIDLFVYTAAISSDNQEWAAKEALGIPTLSRAQLLGQIMLNFDMPIAISGTHGKTTTTSMISTILLCADSDPTITVGGILKSIGGNIRIGQSQYFVTEACEYKDSFLSFFPKIGIILNIDEDHLDYFKDINAIRASFTRFANLIPADGKLIINGDIDKLDQVVSDLKCPCTTFGFDDSKDYYATDIEFDEFAHPSYILHSALGQMKVTLKVPGIHNVANSMAAIAWADEAGIDRSCVSEALGTFTGTDRRFEYKGKLGGVTIIDDYAHHPTEIAATLTAAAKYPHKTLWVAFQPHTYSRTKALLDEFVKALSLADKIILAPIYAAREQNTFGISSEDLQKKLTEAGKECYYFPSFDEIENFILENCSQPDLLITMGAGDIVDVGEHLLGY